jgi:glyoxylase I family protein
MKLAVNLFLSIFLLNPFLLMSQNIKEGFSPVKFEHLRLNVADKDSTARWYVENADLEIIPSDNKEVVCVADKDHNFMFEFTSLAGKRNEYSDIKADEFHIAFEGTNDINRIASKMLAAGGKQDGPVTIGKNGEYLINLRDPNGCVIQLMHRADPFYSPPLKSILRFEHLAFNTPNFMTSSLWFIEFIDLVIPWSKDNDSTKNNLRNYRVVFIGDTKRKMSLELFWKESFTCYFSKVNHDECHLAFVCDNPEKIAKRMVYGGAKQIGPVRTEKNGDLIIDLVDPRSFPIRLIKRKNPLLV